MSNRKLREGLMLNFNNQPGTLSAEKSGGAITQSASFLKRLLLVTLFCVLSFMLSAPSLVQAEDLQEGTPAEQPSTNVQPVNTADPAELITSAASENQAPAKANTQEGDGLEIGPDIIGQPVRQSPLEAPTIDPAYYGATTISGGNVKRKRVPGVGTVRSTVYVTLKDKNGNVKYTVDVTPRSGTTWTVNLPNDIKVAAGDTVTAYQTFDGNDKSPVVTANAEEGLSWKHKDDLQMPSGEIWIENTNANIVGTDEQAEAIEMLKTANPSIADKFKSVVFSIDGTSHAYYEVTYTDGSTSGKIEATELIIKTVTEKSAAPTIEKVQVTDGQITVTLSKAVAAGTKLYFIKEFRDRDRANFNEGRNCNADKSSPREMPESGTVNGTTVTFPITDKVDDLKLGREFGIVVKEPHKFRSCAVSEPVITTPDKVEVRDPHKLTDADKTAIENAIRNANTVNGVSKLPDGTGYVHDPAFIEFDKDGNVTIISPNDVETGWDSNYNPVYLKNPDGTYKLKTGKENDVYKFPAKDLVKNLKPESPKIAVNTDDGKVTITPPPYTEGKDTDLASYTITYKDSSDTEKTVTLTRNVDATTGNTTWTSDGATVDANTGVVTLEIKDLAVGATITAKAKDKGGLEGDTDELESAPASETLETVTVSYDGNGGTGDMDSKKLNKGSKYKILSNAFTAPENEKFKAWKIGDTEYAAGAEITVKENTTIKAIWQDIEVTVSYKANGGSGSMDSATMKKGSKYSLLESTFTAPDDTQEFKAWEVDGQEKAPGTEITVDKDTEVKALWKKIKVNVTYDGNGGEGTMDGKTLDKGSKYTLLESTFTAPDDTQEFDTWEVNGERVAPGTEITVKDNTVVKAVWKNKIPVTVTYDRNGGEGTMEEGKTLYKGDTYKLLASTFTAPANQEFDTWEIDGNKVAAGTEITLTKDTVVKAIWKDIMVDVNFDAGGGSGTMNKESVKKGSTFSLPASGFTPPSGKEFNGWEFNGTPYQVGASITINGDVTVKALWKDKPVPSSSTPGNQKPGDQVKPQPKPQKQHPTAAGGLSRTGANGMYSLYSSMIMLAAGSLFVISRRRRAQR